jgi:hypothetical protein
MYYFVLCHGCLELFRPGALFVQLFIHSEKDCRIFIDQASATLLKRADLNWFCLFTYVVPCCQRIVRDNFLLENRTQQELTSHEFK